MKKYIPILALALSLTACGNENREQEVVTKQEVEENETSTNEKQVIEVRPSKDNAPAEKTEIENTNEEPIDKEVSEDSKEEEQQSQKTDETDDSSKQKKEEKQDNESTMQGQYFSLPYSRIVKLSKDGKMVNELDEEIPSDKSYYTYVKYTNNIFVKEDNHGFKYSIVRMNDQSIDTIYEFADNEGFRPLGLVDGKIYGFHTYFYDDESTGHLQMDSEKSAIGSYDTSTGKVTDFEATRNVMTGDAVVAGNELQFTKPGDNYPQDAYNYDLYRLDLTKDFNQEAELVEKDFNLQYLFGQKSFENGNPTWHIRRADNEHIYVDNKEFPFLWAEQGFQEFIGDNIFYFDTEANTETYQNDPYLVHLKIMNTKTGSTILDENVRGIKLKDGKLYYINEAKEIKSIDLDL